MAHYKNFEFDDDLVRVIRHMSTVEEYREVLQNLQTVWDNLTLLGQLSGTGTDMGQTRHAFHELSNQLLNQLGGETLRKSVLALKSRAQVAIDILVRNLFERTADIGFLATDDDLRHFLLAQEQRDTSHAGDRRGGKDCGADIGEDCGEDCGADIGNGSGEHGGDDTLRQRLRARFSEYAMKYSVYHDIVLMDTGGRVLARLDDSVSVARSSAPLIAAALRGDAPFIESFGPCDLLPKVPDALLYSARVTSSTGKVLGVLCLCFRFADEMAKIFANLVAAQDWTVVMLLDPAGRVVASSDAYHVPVGARIDASFDGDYRITGFGGREYLATVRPTQGYQGYMGPGWRGCAMLPIDKAFESTGADMLADVPQATIDAVMANPSLFGAALRAIPTQAEQIQRDLNRTVWNGNVRQNSAHNRAQNPAFSKILLWEISNTGARTRDVFQRSIANLHETVVSSILADGGFLASLAIDIMDRNLYERANDCRWWALTTAFRQLLDGSDRGPQTTARITAILEYINGLYTVYDNLLVFDDDAKVLAVSNPAHKALVGRRIDADWCTRVLASKDSQSYAVSGFDASDLYGGRHTYVYSAAIRAPQGSRVVGGIGIVFDAAPQFAAMLRDALPRDAAGEVAEAAFAVFVEPSGRVVGCSDERLAPGDLLPDALRLATAGCAQESSRTGICTWQGEHFATGVCRSAGYREYKGPGDAYRNDVTAHVFVRLGAVEHSAAALPPQMPRIAAERDSSQRTLEIATFRLGATWVALPACDIVEAVPAGSVTRPPADEPHFAGFVAYHDKPVPAFDIGAMIGARNGPSALAMVLRSPEHGAFAILADELGEIPEVARSRLTPIPDVMAQRHPLTVSVVNAQVDGAARLVQLLSIDRIIARLVAGSAHVAGAAHSGTPAEASDAKDAALA